ncbi:MAG: dihydroneopterin aldolase [Bacteroidaceae bacterium]|nr:dihydroneopterin aldolase [Bacteroidaceae bacterium]
MTFKNSYIHLKDLRFYAFHGVLPQEKSVGAYFILNICVKVDVERAALTDELSDTVSYADIYQIAKEEMQVTSKLLEHVAGRICKRLYQEFSSVEAVNITIEKENAPIGTGAQGLAGITLHTIR